jgi:hypothetical protein
MNKTLKINIPEGFEIHNFNTETGEVTFRPVKPQITPEELFLQFFDGCTTRFDRKEYPYSIFYFDKDGNYLAEFRSKSNTFYINYSKVWSIFEAEYSLNYSSTRELMNRLVEEHFKLKDVTTFNFHGVVLIRVEEHFKLKDVTTKGSFFVVDHEVEEHFKLK